MRGHIFNVSVILSADNIKYTNVFLPYSFLSSFFKLRKKEIERESECECVCVCNCST